MRDISGDVSPTTHWRTYVTAAFGDPFQAVKTLASDPDRFHLVISDLTMPGRTGIEVATEAKKIRPDLPIILTSGFTRGG